VDAITLRQASIRYKFACKAGRKEVNPMSKKYEEGRVVYWRHKRKVRRPYGEHLGELIRHSHGRSAEHPVEANERRLERRERE
jgi:hypothetical protein